MGFNIAGGVTGSLAEVETASLALRVTSRPIDVGTLGSYLIATDNGTTVMTAGLAANSPVFSWRWGNSNIAVLNKIVVSMESVTAFAAGRIALQAFFARSFTASDTGGTALTLTGNNGKKRTSFGTTLLTDCRISATATLTAGTRTLDTQPFGEVESDSTAVATLVAGLSLYQRDVIEQYPIVFAQNEGFVIQASVAGTGTWFFSVAVDWTELAAY